MADEHVSEDLNSQPQRKANKRKYEATILDNFTKLSKNAEGVRIKGGVELLKHLSENETRENGDSELKYALLRLIRGLGSGSIPTKAGFFGVFTGILNFGGVTIEEVLEIVEKELHKGGSNSKSENADIASGKQLVSTAVIRSESWGTCDVSQKVKILELLVNAGKERTYLTIGSYKVLSDLYKKITQKEFKTLVLPLIQEELSKPWSLQTLDSLYLLLETQENFPNVISSKFLEKGLGTSDIITQENLLHICRILTNLPRLSVLNHLIFAVIPKKIVENGLVKEFFEELDQSLQKPNRSRAFVETELLNKILTDLENSSLVPELLTKNYLQYVINSYKTNVGKSRDKQFEEITQKLFETILTVVKKDTTKDKVRIKIIKRLLFYPGVFIFEKITRSKLIQNITGCLGESGVRKLAGIYQNVIVASEDKVINESSSEKWWNQDRVYASHLLAKLLNHPSAKEVSWKIETLCFLLETSLIGNPEIGSELGDALKETFYSALDFKLIKLEELRVILTGVVTKLDGIIKEGNLRVELGDDSLEVWQKTLDLCQKLEKKSTKKTLVFHILFQHLSLQIFNNPKLAGDSLEELFSCYDRVKKSKTDPDDPLWIEVVTDLFLNLLSQNSHLLRSVINHVFPHLCKYLNAEAIHQILGVLDPKNQENVLSRLEESDEEDDEENDDDNEEAVSDEESESGEDEEIGEETINDKLRSALQQALCTETSDAESMDLDELEAEDGEKLDENLTRVFKQFKPNLGRRKKQNKDDQTLTHFRVRVLDLIEIYLNSTPSMILALEIMPQLLQVFEFSIRDDHQRPLQNRVGMCLKKLCALKKFQDQDGVTVEVLVELLKSLLGKGTKNAIIIQDMGEKISECCIFIVNCAQTLQAGGDQAIMEVLLSNLEAFFKRRDCLTPCILFKNLLQMNLDDIKQFIAPLVEYSFADDVRPFRRNQALELLKIFYQNHRYFHSYKNRTVKKQTRGFLNESIKFLEEFNANPEGFRVKEKFLGTLFEVLSTIKTCPLEEEFENWDNLGELIRECRSQTTLSKIGKGAFSKLCRTLNISNVVVMKNNNTDKDK